MLPDAQNFQRKYFEILTSLFIKLLQTSIILSINKNFKRSNKRKLEGRLETKTKLFKSAFYQRYLLKNRRYYRQIVKRIKNK